MLEKQLSTLLGEPVWIPDCTTTLWPPQLNIQGLQIGDAQENIVQLQRLDINFQVEKERPWVQSIEVQEPVVVLSFDEQGLIPFRKRIRGNKPIKDLPFEHLRIINGTISAERDDDHVLIRDVNIDFHKTKGIVKANPNSILIRNRAIQVEPLAFEFSYSPGDVSIPSFSIDLEGLSIDGYVHIKETIDSSFQISGNFPEVLRGKKIHLEGELDTTCSITKDTNGLSIILEGISHDTELHRLLRSGIRDFLPFSDVYHRFHWKDGKMIIDELTTPFADGLITAVGEYSVMDDELSLQLQLNDLPLWRLGQDMRLSESPWVDGILKGIVHLSGSLRNLELSGPLDIQIQELQTATGSIKEQGPLIETSFVSLGGEIDITRTNLHIHDSYLSSGENLAELDYFIQWGADPKTNIEVNFSNLVLDSLRPLAGMNFTGEGSAQLHLWGVPKSYSFTLAADIYRFGMLGFYPIERFQGDISSPNLKQWTFTELSLMQNQTTLSGSLELDFASRVMDANIMTDAGRIEDIIPIFFSFSGLEGDVRGSVQLQGPFTDLDIRSEMEIGESRLWGESFTEGAFSLHMKEKFLTVDEFTLKDNSRNVHFRGSMDEEKNLNFEAYGNRWNIAQLDLIRELELPLNGDIQFYT